MIHISNTIYTKLINELEKKIEDNPPHKPFDTLINIKEKTTEIIMLCTIQNKTITHHLVVVFSGAVRASSDFDNLKLVKFF